MCGRYWIDPGDDQLEQIIAQMQRTDLPVKTSGEIFPGDALPVLCLSRAGNERAFAMTWGFALPNGQRVINARSETAREKPLFAQSMAQRRCLLPMSAYFEWQKDGREKIKYRIAPVEPGMYFLAGLYRFEGNRPVCCVLTLPASPELAPIHPRMPLILPAQAQKDWLRQGAADGAKALQMRAVRA